MAMACLKEIRDQFIDLDFMLIEIEDMYNILTKNEIDLTQENFEKFDSLRYNFEQMLSQVNFFKNSRKIKSCSLCFKPTVPNVSASAHRWAMKSLRGAVVHQNEFGGC